jgi:hypothetical protein
MAETVSTKPPVADPAPPPGPTPAEIAAALAQFNSATDRVAVLAQYPWLTAILNQPQS